MTVAYTSVTPDWYDCDGVQAEFGFTFRILTDTDVRVIHVATDGTETVQTIAADYTVSPGPWDTGPTYGSVTMLSAPADGKILLKPAIQADQSDVDLSAGGRFKAEAVERALDKLTLLIQQVLDAQSKGLRLPERDTGPILLPPRSELAGKILAFDPNGNPFATDSTIQTEQAPVTDYMKSLLTAPSAAAARGLLGDVLAPDGDGSGLANLPMVTPLSTAGDLMSHDGTGPVRISAGEPMRVPVSNGAGTAFSWADAPNPPGKRVVKLPASAHTYRFSAFLTADGAARLAGYTENGESGSGTSTGNQTLALPAAMPRNVKIKDLYVTRHNAFALTEAGEVYGWGYNAYGQIGLGNATERTIPTKIPGLSNVAKLAVATSTTEGLNHVLALDADGNVFAWGYNGFGQVGNGTTVDQSSPVLIKTGCKDIAIAGGRRGHSHAIDIDGNPFAWGHNATGELGVGDTTARNTPTPVTLPAPVKEIFPTGECWSTSCGLTRGNTYWLLTDGRVYAAGSNSLGQIGDGALTTRAAPVRAGESVNLTDVVKISANNGCQPHVLALIEGGGIRVWGANNNGQLGLDHKNTQTAPADPGITNVADVETGGSYTAGVSAIRKTDGTIWTCGYGANGPHGLGDTQEYTTFQQVNVPEAVDVKFYGSYTEAFMAILTKRGDVYFSGYNGQGAHSNGTTITRLAPAMATL